MPSISSWLSELSRRKLRVAASSRDGLRDTLNLRRFVLLKNSITNAESPSPSPSYSQHLSLPSSDGVDVHTPTIAEACIISNSNDSQLDSNQDSEEKWLESVLENLDEDYDCEVEVKATPVEEELTFLEFELDDPFESWMSPYNEYDEDDEDPLPFSFPSNTSSVLPSLRSPAPLQLLLCSPNSPFNQPFIEPRYPEADFDLPSSEASSDGESDDDDEGLLTPYGGSQPSLREQSGIRPNSYADQDSYFLCPSELDLISPPPYFHQC